MGLDLGNAVDTTWEAQRAAAREPARGPWRRALGLFGRQRVGVLALAILVAMFVAGALATRIAPYYPNQLNLGAVDHPLSPTLAGHHFFGTDELGRDLFSQTLYGIRTSAAVSLAVAAAATLIGVLIGAFAGYYGGWLDAALMRLVDVVVTVPALGVLLAATVYFRELTPRRIGLILILYMWTAMARVVRASFASLRETEFVEAAHAAGASDLRIMLRHLLPNSSGAIIVAATSLIGQAILLEATIDFFNFGTTQTVSPTLGNLVADSTKYGLGSSWWWLYTMPAIVIVLLLVCVNFVGDSLDEALAPAR